MTQVRIFLVFHGFFAAIFIQDTFSNGMLEREIKECYEAYEQFLDTVGEASEIELDLGLGHDEFAEMRLQFEKLRRMNSEDLLKMLR